jgi:hypothetical protein
MTIPIPGVNAARPPGLQAGRGHAEAPQGQHMATGMADLNATNLGFRVMLH